MPRTQRNSERDDMDRDGGRDLDGDGAGAPRVYEVEPEDDKAQVKLYDEDTTIDIEEDDIAQEIDLDDLVAMDGPDA